MGTHFLRDLGYVTSSLWVSSVFSSVKWKCWVRNQSEALFQNLGVVFISWSCHGKEPHTGRLKTAEIYSLPVWRLQSGIEVLAGPCSLPRLQGTILPCFFQLLVSFWAGNPCHSSLCRCISQCLSASICVWPSSLGISVFRFPFSYKDTCRIALEPIPLEYDLIST